MRKIIIAGLVVIGVTLIVLGVSVLLSPGWLDIPGGWLLLGGAAFEFAAGLGGKLKDWSDLLFTGKSKPHPAPTGRSQEMTRSPLGEQRMHGRGAQQQKMSDSPGGKQNMD